MAWVREHRTKSGEIVRYVVARNPAYDPSKPKGPENRQTITRALGPMAAERARAEADVERVHTEGRKARRERLEPASALDRFLAHLRTVKRRRQATEDFYKKLLEPMLTWMGERAPMRRWHAGMLSDYVATLTTYSAASVRKVIVAAGTFVKWARRSQVDVPDFASDVERPSVVRAERAAFTAEERDRILAAADADETPGWLRVAVYLAAEAGLSLGDLRTVRWEEIDLAAGVLRRARAKTGQPVEVPISPPLLRVLKAAAPMRRRGLVAPDLPVDDAGAAHTLRRLYARAGVAQTGGFKRLRHTFATELVRTGVDLPTLRELLGHAPGSLQAGVYLHTTLARKQTAIAGLRGRGRKAQT